MRTRALRSTEARIEVLWFTVVRAAVATVVTSYDASKASEEPFRRDIDRVGSRSLFVLVKLGLTCSDVEPNKIFDGCKIRGGHILP